MNTITAEDLALVSGPMVAVELREALQGYTFRAAVAVPETVLPAFAEPEIDWNHAATKDGAVISERRRSA